MKRCCIKNVAFLRKDLWCLRMKKRLSKCVIEEGIVNMKFFINFIGWYIGKMVWFGMKERRMKEGFGIL